MARPMATRCCCPPRELGGMALEELLEPEELRRLAHPFLDAAPGRAAHAKRETEVLAHRHVRVQRIALEHHRHVAVARRHVVHPAAADQDFAFGDALEAGHHAQERRLAGARRPHQHHELAVGDVQIDAVQHRVLAEALGYRAQADRAHPAPSIASRTPAARLSRLYGLPSSFVRASPGRDMVSRA